MQMCHENEFEKKLYSEVDKSYKLLDNCYSGLLPTSLPLIIGSQLHHYVILVSLVQIHSHSISVTGSCGQIPLERRLVIL